MNELEMLGELPIVVKAAIEAGIDGQVRSCPTPGRIVGPADPRKKQPRNQPCGCGSGVKAKKCCGDYPRVAK